MLVQYWCQFFCQKFVCKDKFKAPAKFQREQNKKKTENLIKYYKYLNTYIYEYIIYI